MDGWGGTHIQHLVDLTKGEIDRRIFSDPDIYQRELQQIFARITQALNHG